MRLSCSLPFTSENAQAGLLVKFKKKFLSQAILFTRLFFRSSESEEEEEEWEPKSKTAKRPRLPKKNAAKPKKVAAPRSAVARKKVKKVATKEEIVSICRQETFTYCSCQSGEQNFSSSG